MWVAPNQQRRLHRLQHLSENSHREVTHQLSFRADAGLLYWRL